MALFDLSVEDDKNEVHHDLFIHVMPITLASSDADDVIHGNIAFPWGKTTEMKCYMMFWSNAANSTT